MLPNACRRRNRKDHPRNGVRAATYLAIIEVRIALSVEDHCVVAHHEEIAAQVVQRQEGTRHDALSDQREIHRFLDHLEGEQTGATVEQGPAVRSVAGQNDADKMKKMTAPGEE